MKDGEFEEVDPFELLAKRRASKTKSKVDDSYDSQQDSDFEVIDTDASVKRRMGRRGNYDIPNPIYTDVITKVGDVQGKSKLEQAMQFFAIDSKDYLWWNGDQEVQIQVPRELGGGPSWQPDEQPPEKGRSKSHEPKKKPSTQRAIITKGRLFLFNVKSKLENMKDAFKVTTDHKALDLEQDKIDELDDDKEIKIADDWLEFELMDFEFLEKRPQPKYSFLMKIYNKENTTSEQMPFLYFHCTSKE